MDPWHDHDNHFLKSPGSFTEDLHSNFVISACYRDPAYEKGFVFPAKILEGAKERFIQTDFTLSALFI